MSEKSIGYAVVIADQLDKSRSLSFQLNFEQGADAEQMNKELDKLVSVFDRQRARAAIYEAEQFLKAQHNILGGIETDMEAGKKRLVLLAEPDPTRRNPPNLAKQLKDNLEQQEQMIANVRAKIKAAEEELEILRQKAA